MKKVLIRGVCIGILYFLVAATGFYFLQHGGRHFCLVTLVSWND
jgi:hypothetical protein